MYLKRKTLLFIAGGVWFSSGLYLMILGLRFLEASVNTSSTPFLSLLEHYLSRDYALVMVIVAAIILGQLKGRSVMTRAALRASNRILHLPEPAHIKNLYSGRFYLVIVFMISLGVVLKLLQLPLDVRGAVDVVIGTALIQGAVVYFKQTTLLSSHL